MIDQRDSMSLATTATGEVWPSAVFSLVIGILFDQVQEPFRMGRNAIKKIPKKIQMHGVRAYSVLPSWSTDRRLTNKLARYEFLIRIPSRSPSAFCCWFVGSSLCYSARLSRTVVASSNFQGTNSTGAISWLSGMVDVRLVVSEAWRFTAAIVGGSASVFFGL